MLDHAGMKSGYHAIDGVAVLVEAAIAHLAVSATRRRACRAPTGNLPAFFHLAPIGSSVGLISTV